MWRVLENACKTDSFIKKASRSWKGNFRCISSLWDKRTSGSGCIGWPADKQAETNINFMQYRSEPPLDKWKGLGRFDTELLLQPISSCNQDHSCCRRSQQSTALSPSPHSQQVSGAVLLPRAALAFHTLSPTPWYFPDTSTWKLLPC